VREPRNLMSALLSPEEVADFCGYSRKAIYRAIERGELRATKRCSRWRIWADDLQRWLETGVPARPERPRPHGARGPSPTPSRRGSFRALLASEEEQP
jgi:excisionase family DNA binding protein